ncbi:hypothetical protein ACC733_37410, partial [Rhizobium johnstonii]|uniref:hypothetical protein n=1 Tax=Rhizobium johnstonii TaxID=3019933 RepID=UPI003F951AB8
EEAAAFGGLLRQHGRAAQALNGMLDRDRGAVPGGTLVELATDKPGMTVDEEQAALGGKLLAPPEAITNLHDLKVMLPQF